MSVIQLGAPGALRKYVVKARGDGLMWGRGPASPFSAKVNSSNKYDQVDIWNEWVQEDWQAGVGRVNPEEGGFLYGELDSRVPNQLILSPAIGYAPALLVSDREENWFGHLPASQIRQTSANITLAIGSGTGIERLACRTTFDAGDNASPQDNLAVYAISFYGYVATGVELNLALQSSVDGLPGTTLATTILTATGEAVRPEWYGAVISTPYTATLTSTSPTYYWAVIYPTSGTMTLVGAVLPPSNSSGTKKYASGAWSGQNGFFPFFHVALGYNVLTD